MERRGVTRDDEAGQWKWGWRLRCVVYVTCGEMTGNCFLLALPPPPPLFLINGFVIKPNTSLHVCCLILKPDTLDSWSHLLRMTKTNHTTGLCNPFS